MGIAHTVPIHSVSFYKTYFTRSLVAVFTAFFKFSQVSTPSLFQVREMKIRETVD